MFALMDKLREEALHVGGQVLSHLGNHEVRIILMFAFFSLLTFLNLAAHERSW